MNFEPISIPTPSTYSTTFVKVEDLSGFTFTTDKVLVYSSTPFSITKEGYQVKSHILSQTGHLYIYEKENLECDVTFVIQGLDHKNTLNVALSVAPYGAISLGIWEDDFQIVKQIQIDNNYDNWGNKYFQFASTLKGLSKVNTPYVIKVRSDEFFINYTSFIKKLKSLPSHVIITSNIYFRSPFNWPYHISDHIIGGRKEFVKRMFYSALLNVEQRRYVNKVPEEHLAGSYLDLFNDFDITKHHPPLVWTFMTNMFYCFPIQEFDDYHTYHYGHLRTKKDGIARDHTPIDTFESLLKSVA